MIRKIYIRKNIRSQDARNGRYI